MQFLAHSYQNKGEGGHAGVKTGSKPEKKNINESCFRKKRFYYTLSFDKRRSIAALMFSQSLHNKIILKT